MRVKKKQKRSKRAAERKSKTQQDGMTSKEQEAELLAQKQLAEQMCMQADAHFFGFAPNANKKEALRLYEESESYGNSKAMLALGLIYEKGLINENSEQGGITSMGALESASTEPDFMKAWDYYDQASDMEPYATFKLGQFMEKGLYEEGNYRVKPSFHFAFNFYRKAVQ